MKTKSGCKRAIALWLSTCLLCGCLAVTPITASALLLGDMDGNGSVNTRDTMALFRLVATNNILSEEQRACADVDQNGAINMRDVKRLYSAVASGEVPEIPDPDTLTHISVDEYYGRSVLVASGQEHLVVAYDYIGEQIAAFNKEISLYEYGLTVAEMERVIQYYYDDHPEVFWMQSAYRYYSYTKDNAKYAYSFLQNYEYTPEEVREWQEKLAVRVKELTAGLTDNTPAVEREKTVHDRLLLAADYDQTLATPHAHDLIGIMLEGTGVCESYARALQYALHQCGIPSGVVRGYVNGSERHMWNTALIDGAWYHVDPTWNDPILPEPMPSYIAYDYFNVPTARWNGVRRIYAYYSSDDAAQETTYPLPDCTSTTAYWPLCRAVELSAFDANVMGKALADAVTAQEYVYFRAVGAYTYEALKADVEDGNRFWAIIDTANALLGDKAIKPRSYFTMQDPDYGIYGLYLIE